MTRRVLVVLVTAVTALAAAPPASAQSAPSIALSLTAATVGQEIVVTGTAFPAAVPVTVHLCGDEGRAGTTDCDVLAGQTVVTSETGAFAARVVARFPPVPCPCVVLATASDASHTIATAPIGVVAAPVAAPPSATAPVSAPDGVGSTVDVTALTSHSADSWRGWLGLPFDVVVTVSVRNTGRTVVRDPVLVLNMGTDRDAREALDAPPLGDVAPGETKTVDVVVRIPPLTFGERTITAAIAGGDRTELMTTSVRPWGLVAIAFLAVAVIAVLVRRRRRTVAAEPSPLMLPEPVVPEPETVPVFDAPPTPADSLFTVTFTYPRWSRAEAVALVGDFNDWDPTRTPMERGEDGTWRAEVRLRPWSYRYRFVVDGQRWDNDWAPDAFLDNSFGSRDSLIIVGHEDRCADATYKVSPAKPAVDPFDGAEMWDTDALSASFETFWSEEPDPVRTRIRRLFSVRSAGDDRHADRL